MAGTLVTTVNSSAKVIRVSGLAEPLSGSQLLIESELVTFRSVKRLNVPPFRKNEDGDWNVVRGALGTTAASHTNGVDVALYVPVYGADPLENAGGGLPAGFVMDADDENWLGATLVLTDPTKKLDIIAGDATGATAYGYVEITGDTDPAVEMYAQDNGATNNASVKVDASDGSIVIASSGLIRLSSDNLQLVIQLTSLPTSDPGIEGVVYTDGAAAADSPKHLMVSGGTTP